MVGIDDRQENSIRTPNGAGRSTNCALPERNTIEESRCRVPFALTFPEIGNLDDNCSGGGARILIFSVSLVGRPRTLEGSRIMRRGSIQTWESLARRHSSNMAQFSNSRSEFMTSDLGLNDIEYERKGGFFMTNRKTALAVCAVVLVVIAAGFVGAYIGSIPKEKGYDTLAFIDGDVGCNNVASSKFSLAESIRPHRYRIDLSPIVEDEPISRLRGRVVVDFLYNGSADLGEIVMNARRMQVTRTRLVSSTAEEPSNSQLGERRRRRRRNPEVNIKPVEDLYNSLGGNSTVRKESTVNETGEATTTASVPEGSTDLVFPTTLIMENRTIAYEVATNDSTANSTSSEDNGHPPESLPTSSGEEINMAVSHDVKALAPETPSDKDFVQPTRIDSSTPQLNGSSISGNADRNESSEIEINGRELDDEGGFLVLRPASPIVAGEYSLEIDYEVPVDGYVVHLTNGSDKWLPTVGIKSSDVRNLFPVFDDVRMKARFSLTLPRPIGLKIYSNMPIESTVALSNEWVLDKFEETPPLSPGSLAVAATGQLESLGQRLINDTNVTFWAETLKSGPVKYSMDIVELAILVFVDIFGVDFPLPKLDIIGLRDVDHDYAHPGLITIPESLYLVDDDSSAVTREFAHMKLIMVIGLQWLGGMVNTRNSSDDWIVESSLLYLQHRLMEELNPVFNHSTFIMDVQPSALEADGYSVSRFHQSKLNTSHSSSFHANEAYAIGACLIHMLHGALRQTEFPTGYRSFVSRWTGGNADAASFWEAMTLNATEDEQPESEAKLTDIMNLWTTENGYPVVTVTRNYETGSAVVHQDRFSYDTPSSASQQLWHIPVSWITNGNGSQISWTWIKQEVDSNLDNVSQPGDKSWVVFNPTKSGYFRVNYDEDNWKLLAEALRNDHKIFSPETRASLVDDVFSLGFVGQLPYSMVFDVIGYMPGNEIEPEPWTYLFHHAVKLNLALYDSPVYPSYQEFMAKFLSDLYTQVGSKNEEGTRLTLISHQLACMFNYPDYYAWARKSYAGYENSTGLPIKNDVPSYLHKNLLCAFAKLEHELGWQWWQQKFTNVTNREERNPLLSSLACFQVPSMLQAVLNAIVYSTSFEEKDALVILESFSDHPAASQTALQFVEGNWKNITRRYSKSCKIASAFLDASSTGFTGEKDIEDFQSFRDKNYNSLKKVGYTTALLEAKANASVSFLQRSLGEFETTIVNRTSF